MNLHPIESSSVSITRRPPCRPQQCQRSIMSLHSSLCYIWRQESSCNESLPLKHPGEAGSVKQPWQHIHLLLWGSPPRHCLT